MLSLSFDEECVCARDYAIIQVLLYVSLTLNARGGVCYVGEWRRGVKSGVI
jgi:hypothetical protein